MKKRITRPDGTVEEFEGTAEEIAQIERESARSSGEPSKAPVQEDQGSRRRVLTDEIQRLVGSMSDEELSSLKVWAEFIKSDAWKRLLAPPTPVYVPAVTPWWVNPYPYWQWPYGGTWISTNGNLDLTCSAETIVDTTAFRPIDGVGTYKFESKLVGDSPFSSFTFTDAKLSS